MTRQLTSGERGFVLKAANQMSVEKREMIERDLATATNESVDRIELSLREHVRPIYTGHTTIGEGKIKDADGVELDVLLNVDSAGRMLEIEFIRYDTGLVIGPDWSTLKLLAASNP